LLHFLIIAVASWCGPVTAEAGEYVLSPRNAKIGFHLDGNLHATHGNAKQFTGRVRVPEDLAPEGYSTEITLPVMALDTDNGARDKKMHFTCLEADRLPNIHFQSTVFQGFPAHIQRGKNFDFTLVGDLTIRAITKKVVIPVMVRSGEAGLHLSGSVWLNYIEDFHIPDPSVFIFRVAKKVKVILEVDLPYALFEDPGYPSS